MNPKISIIIPICNVEKYLKFTLDSVLRQSLEDIEIICVDDFSMDQSREILDEYAKKDSRIRVILHEKNLSTSVARKDGVLASTGKYIMFLDGDDELFADSCQTAFDAIEQLGVDMVHFESQVVNAENIDTERVNATLRALSSFKEVLNETDLIKACWDEKKFGFTLWNKIYNGDICRKAFQKIEDSFLPRDQDLYAFFVIAYFSKSYAGISDELYSYRLGSGVTGGNFISKERFRILTFEKDVCSAIERFLNLESIYGDYKHILSNIEQQFLNECVYIWLHIVIQSEQKDAFNSLIQKWPLETIIKNLTERHWDKKERISEYLSECDFLDTQRINKSIKNIAFYYHKINNGGAERVTSLLCNLFAQKKDKEGQFQYNVVLITDEIAHVEDYYLDSRVKREFIAPFASSEKVNYSARYDDWKRVLITNNIECIISGLWVSKITFWDIISIKSINPNIKYIMHQHGFSCVPHQFLIVSPFDVSSCYAISDGVVVLSDTDTIYASAYNDNCKFICNPIFMDETEIVQTSYVLNEILWVGRISNEKNPVAAVEMMKYIVPEIPNAILRIIGEGDDALIEVIRQKITEYNLDKNISLEGFTKNVEQFYKRGSVLVSTSDYEGYPLTYGEALAHGIPIVAFDLPWLFFMQRKQGVIPVKFGRIDLLAKEVKNLLLDNAYCKQKGNEGRMLMHSINNNSILKQWEEFIHSTKLVKKNIFERGNDNSLIIQYINEYQAKGRKIAVQNAKKHRDNIDATKENKLRELNALLNSWSFRIGRKITYIPRKIRKLIQAGE